MNIKSKDKFELDFVKFRHNELSSNIKLFIHYLLFYKIEIANNIIKL